MARTGDNARISAIGQYGGPGGATFAADLTELADDVAELIGPSVATVGALPTSGNWTGRTIFVLSNKTPYVWDGTQWSSTQRLFGRTNGMAGGMPPASAIILTQAGVSAVGTNVNGDGTLNYPVAFPNGVLSVLLQRWDYNALGGTYQVLSASQTLTGAGFRVFQSTGVPLTSATVLFAFTAIGW